MTHAISLGKKKTLWAILLATMIVGFGLGAIHPLVAFTMRARGFTGTQIGIAAACYSIANIIIPMFIAQILRHVSLVVCLLASIVVFCACVLSYHFLYAFPYFVLVRSIHGASVSFIFVLTEYWINSMITNENRGAMIGLYATLLSLGFALGPVALYVAGTDSFMPFVCVTFITLIAAIPIFFFISELKDASHEEEGENVHHKAPLLFLFHEPVTILAPFCYGMMEMLTFALLPIYVHNAGYGTNTAIFSIAVFVLGNIVFQIPLGMLSKRFSILFILGSLSLLGVLISFPLPFVAQMPLIAGLLLFLQGGLSGGMYTVALIDIGNRFHGRALVNINAAFALYYAMGSLIGPPLAGLMIDHFPMKGLPFLMGTIALAYLALTLVVFLKKRGQAPKLP